MRTTGSARTATGAIFRATIVAALCTAAEAAVPSPGVSSFRRSDQAALPESIGRECAAAVERAQDWLLSVDPCDGVFPAPPADIPWGARETEEAALAVLDASIAGRTPPEALVRRLCRASPAALPSPSAALALCANESVGADASSFRDALLRRRPPAHPGASDVAAAALARLSRAVIGDESLSAARAHLRHLASRFSLGFATNGRGETGEFAVTPESALLAALLAAQFPRRELADPSLGLFPWDWRNHLANRLLARQTWDPETGLFAWTGPDGTLSTRDTRLAILALRLMMRF